MTVVERSERVGHKVKDGGEAGATEEGDGVGCSRGGGGRAGGRKLGDGLNPCRGPEWQQRASSECGVVCNATTENVQCDS